MDIERQGQPFNSEIAVMCKKVFSSEKAKFLVPEAVLDCLFVQNTELLMEG